MKPTLNDATPSKKAKHWSLMAERGSFWGIWFLLKINQIFGRWLFRLFIWPIVAYFFVTGKTARTASMQYLTRVYRHPQQQVFSKKPGYFASLKHFIYFAESALDKLDAWSGKLKVEDVHYQNRDEIYEQLLHKKQGAVFIGAHLGNLEVCRALNKDSHTRVNVMVFTQHAAQFNRVLKKLDPDADVDLIQVTNVSAELAILLKQRIDDGEHVVIAADRTSTSSFGRSCKVPFFNDIASISQGPFILAQLLDCPVYMLFCLKQHDGFHVTFEHFDRPFKCARKERQAMLQQQISQYVERLTHYCLQYPYQWFNFFDFWHDDDQVERDKPKEHLKEN